MARPNNEQFTPRADLIAVAIGYTNPDISLIADDVLPRVDASYRFDWQSYDEAESFTLPDTRIGRRSAPNQVEIEGTQKTSQVEDFGIDVPLDNPTIKEAEQNGWDPEKRATMRATNIVLLDREVRVANKVTDPANYHADHRRVLAGTDQFDHADSDPVDLLLEMLDECWMRPNQLVFGNNVWRKFRQNPKVIKAINANSGDSGVARREDVAELLEVQRILVGSARVNIKKPGENPVIARTWGNVVAGQFIDSTADTTGGITFGFTAQNGQKVAGTKQADMGLHGGKLVRSGESVKELIVANRAGFLLEDVLAA
jgi:hypothetical protein